MEAILKKELIKNKTLSRTLGVLIFAVLTSLSAFVRIPLPFTPVPVTLQTFFVLLSGVALGSNLGAASQLVYLFIGIAGVPVFTSAGSGLLYILGPTGGYLWGFVLASLFAGKFIKYAKDNLFYIVGVLFLAELIILSSGLIWLKFTLGYPLGKLFLMGFLPFIPGDLLKLITASFLFVGLKPRLKQIF